MTTHHIVKAREIGREHGRNAAEWFLQDSIGGRVSAQAGLAAAKRIQDGVADGDPEVLDMLPHPDLSGQHADGMTPRLLVAEATGRGEDYDDYQWTQELCDVYEAEFQVAVQAKVEQACREMLAPVEGACAECGGVTEHVIGCGEMDVPR